jgi:hypothetical protein
VVAPHENIKPEKIFRVDSSVAVGATKLLIIPMWKYFVRALLIVIAIALFAAAADAGSVDPRFDGRWVGFETLQYSNGYESLAGPAPQMKTTILIAESGTMVGVVEGIRSGALHHLAEIEREHDLVRFRSQTRQTNLVGGRKYDQRGWQFGHTCSAPRKGLVSDCGHISPGREIKEVTKHSQTEGNGGKKGGSSRSRKFAFVCG